MAGPLLVRGRRTWIIHGGVMRKSAPRRILVLAATGATVAALGLGPGAVSAQAFWEDKGYQNDYGKDWRGDKDDWNKDKWEKDRWEKDRWEKDKWGKDRWEKDRWEKDKWGKDRWEKDKRGKDDWDWDWNW
ncbi:hypothetical protein [Parafrankia elaeagni]|uniref:hypothetical protein n=1 Tax=Parafrankia elaeagni TaxID=222534 RepID=UPI001E5D83CD|nr:hypothetical protein [Parafrankia elaeagni]